MGNFTCISFLVAGVVGLVAALPLPASAGACITQTCTCDDDCPGLVCSAEGVCCGPPVTGTPCEPGGGGGTAGGATGGTGGAASGAGGAGGTAGATGGAGGTAGGTAGAAGGAATEGTAGGAAGASGAAGGGKSDDDGCSVSGRRAGASALWLAPAVAWLARRRRAAC